VLSKDASGLGASLSVRDQGEGLTRAEQKQLFQRFSRLDNAATRRAGGSGLGLTICSEIARLHGGSMSVESAPGQGSEFFLRLPGR
jgi:signal transduction histidine kinase